jgi:hypothetical protein
VDLAIDRRQDLRFVSGPSPGVADDLLEQDSVESIAQARDRGLLLYGHSWKQISLDRSVPRISFDSPVISRLSTFVVSMILRGKSASSSESFDFLEGTRRADADKRFVGFLLDIVDVALLLVFFWGGLFFSGLGAASAGCCGSTIL